MSHESQKTRRDSKRASGDEPPTDRYVWYKMQVMVEVDTLDGTVTRAVPMPGRIDEDDDDEFRYVVAGKPPN